MTDLVYLEYSRCCSLIWNLSLKGPKLKYIQSWNLDHDTLLNFPSIYWLQLARNYNLKKTKTWLWTDRRFMVVDWKFSYILWGIEYGCSAHFAAFKPPKTAESHWNSKLHLMPHIFHCLSKWKQEPAFLIWEIFSRENLSPGINK